MGTGGRWWWRRSTSTSRPKRFFNAALITSSSPSGIAVAEVTLALTTCSATRCSSTPSAETLVNAAGSTSRTRPSSVPTPPQRSMRTGLPGAALPFANAVAPIDPAAANLLDPTGFASGVLHSVSQVFLKGDGVSALLFLAGNLALQYGAARLPANVTSVVMLTEILFASVSALLLGGGSLNAQLLTGGALILLAALLSTLASAPDASH